MKKTVRHISRLLRNLGFKAKKKTPDHPGLSGSMVDAIRQIFDVEWYSLQYPHVIRARHDPFRHFIWHGMQEGLAPNAFFLSAWYLDRYKDVCEAGCPPLVHYLMHGAAEGRNPHPDFDAAWYVTQHPEARDNPLLFHMNVGRAQLFPTRPAFCIEHYLPASGPLLEPPSNHAVDIILPVYKGLEETRRCLESVIADKHRPSGRIIVLDDCSPEPELSQWLDDIAATGAIHLLRNEVNLGFVRTVNRGMVEAGQHDVVLLNSDTEVPQGWLRRLAGHAWAQDKVGTVTPFSNNATIFSYPSAGGGPLPEGYDLKQMDEAFQHANAGRSIPVPTAVGFCMYIRRDCLDEVGLFDADTFRQGYGEENDFCMRARTLGWEHLLACDTYVFHEGEVSFGTNSPSRTHAEQALSARYPDYLDIIQRHMQSAPADPARFAASCMLLKSSGRPAILFITHDLGGGTERHVQDLVNMLKGRAECLVLRPGAWGVDLLFPGITGLPGLHFDARHSEELSRFLKSCGVQRVHIHHQIGYHGHLLHDIVQHLALPFDLTIHDYFSVCPQINLISSETGKYCETPEPASCNSCIAQRPVHGASDIITWRLQHRWMFDEAERVLCPSRDVMLRLQDMGLPGRMQVAPHEPAQGEYRLLLEPLLQDQPLRIAVLGMLAPHKGAAAVRNAALAAAGKPLEFVLIGASDPQITLPQGCAYHETGPYREKDLEALIQQHAPHLIWFPSQCPETYSYTLTRALESGRPIIASDLGAFPERLATHSRAILVPPSEYATPWLDAFNQMRDALLDVRENTPPSSSPIRPGTEAFYPGPYLEPLLQAKTGTPPVPPALSTPASVRDLRRGDRPSVLLVPDMMTQDTWSPCGYIRTLLPLERLASKGVIHLSIATPRTALNYRADILMCQRHVSSDFADVERLVAHANAQGMRILYDIDDNLLDIPPDHPEHELLIRRAEHVHLMLWHAQAVTVSTPALQQAVSAHHGQIHVIRNSIDERLLCPEDGRDADRKGSEASGRPFRLLYMGTATHDTDMEMVLPALLRLHAKYKHKVQIDVIGITNRDNLPAGMNRVEIPYPAHQTYPAFLSWLGRESPWDAAISPLADTHFNRSKSSSKALDYMAIGALAVLSDVEAYRDLPEDAVLRVQNDPDAWFAALDELVRHPEACRARARAGQAALLQGQTLEHRLPEWKKVLTMAV